MKFTYYKINYSEVYSSEALSSFTMLQLPTLSSSKTRHHPAGKPGAHQQPLPVPPSSQTLATTTLLSASKDSSVLDISYKWNHTLCDLLGLVYIS